MKALVLAPFALTLAGAALTLAGAALASPCGDEIARLQARFDAAAPDATVRAAGVSESTDAKMHHQPTPASAADAKDAADSAASVRDARFEVAIEEARAANDAGDAATCRTAVARAKAALSR
ncbi:MAG: hypothetical protein KGM15_08750 [Pseudomonadota bacterium]|nr:hypothetical protein [Pseudomonadota bacterium]